MVVPGGENDSRNVLSGKTAGPNLAHHSHTGLPPTQGQPPGQTCHPGSAEANWLG